MHIYSLFINHILYATFYKKNGHEQKNKPCFCHRLFNNKKQGYPLSFDLREAQPQRIDQKHSLFVAYGAFKITLVETVANLRSLGYALSCLFTLLVYGA